MAPTAPRTTPPETAAAPPPPCGGSPTLGARRYLIGYVLFVVLLTAAVLGAIRAYPGWLDGHQRSRERYAAERALAALAAGDRDLARAEVALLAEERPIYIGGLFNRRFSEIWEGPVLRDRVTIYERLTAELLRADLTAEAETVAWKTLLEHHITNRPLELIIPWELLCAAKSANEDWFSAFQAARILAAHGAEQVRPPSQMDPLPFADDPEVSRRMQQELPPPVMRALRLLGEQPAAADFRQALTLLERAREQAVNPAVAQQLDQVLHKAYLDAGQRGQAQQLLARKWGRDPGFMTEFWRSWPNTGAGGMLFERDPSLLDYMWRERPAENRLSVANFMDTFAEDSRMRVEDFRDLRVRQLGYFNEANTFESIGGRAYMNQNVAGSIELETADTVRQLAIGYNSSPALGIHPIMLVQVDHDPFIPVYLESEGEAIATVDVNIPPGRHELTFVYLNDAVFAWPSRQVHEDRNLVLHRLALIHVERPG